MICLMTIMLQFTIESDELWLFKCTFACVLAELASIQCNRSICWKRLSLFLHWTHRHSLDSKGVFVWIRALKEGCGIHRNAIDSSAKPIFSPVIMFKEGFFGSLTFKQTYAFLIKAILDGIFNALLIDFVDEIKVIFRFGWLKLSINGALIQTFLLHLLSIKRKRRRLVHIFIHILLQSHSFGKSRLSVLTQDFRGFTHPVFYLFPQQNDNQLSLSSSLLQVPLNSPICLMWLIPSRNQQKEKDNLIILIYFPTNQLQKQLQPTIGLYMIIP